MSIVVTYCERVHSGDWAEPLNSLSNLAYLVAAIWLLRRCLPTDTATRGPLLLSALLALVGIGSFAFHTYPTVLTLYMDVIPIFAFMLALCWQFQTRLLHYNTASSLLIVIALLLSSIYLSTFSALLNGSLLYLPATLLALIAVLLLRQSAIAGTLLIAFGLLLLALLFRTVDNWLCPAIPSGTHFLWHICSAAACALATDSLRHQALLRATDRTTTG